MTYMTVQQAAEAWGLSVRQVQVYCNQGRVPGAQKFGIAWQIPAGTPKPVDARYKTARTQRENSSLGDHSLPQCQVVNSKFDIKMFEANFLTNKLICPII